MSDDDDGVLRVVGLIVSVNIDNPESAVLVLRTDLATALGGLVQSVGRGCTIALVVHDDQPAGT